MIEISKEYYEKLSKLVNELELDQVTTKPMVVKSFFSGAALYVNKTLCVSWSPVGLAFKLPPEEAGKLINSSKAILLKYFPKGYVEKGYALFEKTALAASYWKQYILRY